MKKTKYIAAIALLSAIVVAQGAMAVSNAVEAYLVDYKLHAEMELNDRLKYPLLSYNDNTYIAVRDVAELMGKDIKWYGDRQEIALVKKEDEDNFIKNEETALAIGKAIAAEYYGDKISDTSQYYVAYGEYDNPYSEDFWCVNVVFEAEEGMTQKEALNKTDVRVYISPVTGAVALEERTEDGTYKMIKYMSV